MRGSSKPAIRLPSYPVYANVPPHVWLRSVKGSKKQSIPPALSFLFCCRDLWGGSKAPIPSIPPIPLSPPLLSLCTGALKSPLSQISRLSHYPSSSFACFLKQIPLSRRRFAWGSQTEYPIYPARSRPSHYPVAASGQSRLQKNLSHLACPIPSVPLSRRRVGSDSLASSRRPYPIYLFYPIIPSPCRLRFAWVPKPTIPSIPLCPVYSIIPSPCQLRFARAQDGPQ